MDNSFGEAWSLHADNPACTMRHSSKSLQLENKCHCNIETESFAFEGVLWASC